jgi:two-component system sensor histidine kinase YesM
MDSGISLLAFSSADYIIALTPFKIQGEVAAMHTGTGTAPDRSGRSSILRRLSIKHRLLAAFLITSLLPVAFVAYYSNMKYEKSVTNKISDYSTQILDELSQNASRELEQYETLSENIIINASIQNGLRKFRNMNDYEINELQTRIKDELGEQFFRLSNLANVVILTNDGSTFFDLGYELYPNRQLYDMMKKTSLSPQNAYWSYLRSNRGTNIIALSRKIFAEDDLNLQIGCLIIFIDEKIFSRNVYQDVSLGAGSSIYISDSSGMVVSSVSPDIPKGSKFGGRELFAAVKAQQRTGAARAFQVKLNGSNYLATSSYIPSADWYLIGLIPHEYVVSELRPMRGNIVLLCLLTLLLSGLLSFWIYSSISSPMRSLVQFAKQVRMGRLETSIAGKYADEMDRLTDTINGMVEQLRMLVYRVSAEQQAKREAELKMLQAQINPHFLFNTLNSLKWSAMLGGNASLKEGIESLSELLRNTMLVKDEMIPLEKEIDNLKHYATIQRIRYGDSFSLECAVDEDASDCIVPKFILQPIVENSILHGGGEERRVRITVAANITEQGLRIRISDDGKGFDTDELKSRKAPHSKLSGIGIANVDERIRIHYGENYGLDIRSAVHQGTETTILLPVRKKEGGNDV